ncbi:putative riboflavin biosynthesis protein Rib7 [Macrophomina phaseolina]|uniref:2,5-diamino-6-ribosylamino-4(3H)-pyrimidinone 5'-phosphate reductase n=1 Tax=Macrophomina phaseolina TaxID=35725 RepID=A0ABQ8GDX4_9PEZI|nr:putative riboflavin biosynthesis protein Rib7 [Macrophomina phaseolina]
MSATTPTPGAPAAATATTPSTTPHRETLHFPSSSAALLEPYLPPPVTTTTTTSTTSSDRQARPLVTLTFATSLDSSLALSRTVPTPLSGPASKAMTHHLRSRHAAILVGAGTAVADDPALNCRIAGTGGGNGGEGLAGQPRPVVVDGAARWDWSGGAKCLRLAGEGKGRAPWVVVREGVRGRIGEERLAVLEGAGGRVLEVAARGEGGAMEWADVFEVLAREGVESVMVEGGAGVINALLEPGNVGLVDAVIVTIAPTWLGEGGVVVAPPRRVDEKGRPVAAARLRDVKWCPLGDDVVLCGRLES